jgi:hypothetical protein
MKIQTNTQELGTWNQWNTGTEHKEQRNKNSREPSFHIHWVTQVEIIVSRVAGLVVTPEARVLVRREETKGPEYT